MGQMGHHFWMGHMGAGDPLTHEWNNSAIAYNFKYTTYSDKLGSSWHSYNQNCTAFAYQATDFSFPLRLYYIAYFVYSKFEKLLILTQLKLTARRGLLFTRDSYAKRVLAIV